MSRRSRVQLGVLFIAAVPWLPGAVSANEVFISEILAFNRTTLADEDGEYPDWIELFNAEDFAVNLEGWHLTDDLDEASKWRFPDVEIPARNYLTVFCSRKDRKDPAGVLHTNFRLRSGGEFLGLLRPDGSVAWAFTPEFPAALPDVSVGLGQSFSRASLLGPGAPGAALVPGDVSLGLEWTGVSFDDASWIQGTSGFGYDQKSISTYAEFIQTDIGDVMRNQNSSAYVRLPFDLANPGAVDFLELGMRYEDGFIAYLNGSLVASSQAPEAAEWNAIATDRRDVADAVEVENFELTAFRDRLVAGTNVLALHGLNTSAGNNDFFVLPELSTVSVGDVDVEAPRFFSMPTPGRPNGEGVEGISDPPNFSLTGDAFVEMVEVELSTEDPTAEIRFTTDGTLPGAESELYTGPILIEVSTQIKARAFQAGLLPSATRAESYLILESAVAGFTSDLPLVVIDTFAKSLPRTAQLQPFRAAHVQIFDVGPEGRSSLGDGPVDFVGRGGVKVRGSSTATREKASLAVEIWDDDDQDTDRELLGMPADSDWVLYGPFSPEHALLRNAFAYALSNQIGRYAVRTRFVELFLNEFGGKLRSPVPTVRNYFGVYVLMEKIKLGEDRVDISALTRADRAEPEITGGYLFKIDRPDPGELGFFAGGQPFRYVAPKEADITPEQATWLETYMEDFFAALDGPDFTDPELGYRPFIQVDTFIDFHLLNELPKNPDAFSFSTYVQKPRGEALRTGPVWDFNLSMGVDRAVDPVGWSLVRVNVWWGRLLEDPFFKNAYIERWQELRRGAFSVENIHASIDRLATELEEAETRNFERWAVGIGPGDWQREVDRLKDWYVGRTEWMDCELRRPPALSSEGGRVTAPFELTLSNVEDVGEIYYTLNGPDPMLESGEPAPEALRYTGAISVTDNTRVRARLRIEDCLLVGGSGWSGMSEAVYVVSPFSIALTEIMYNPAPGQQFEYLEIFNFGNEPVSLDGASFVEGVEFVFESDFVLAPGEYALVVRDLEAFASLYETSALNIAGVFTGVLRDRGEAITLEGPVSEPIFSAGYVREWYPETNGGGHSLVLVDPTSSPETWDEQVSWLPSLEINGSPGSADGGDLGGGQISGDANQDARFNIADAVFVLFYVFRGDVGELPCGDGSADVRANIRLLDANDDGSINFADATHNLNYLFQKGPPPASGRACLRIAGCPEICTP